MAADSDGTFDADPALVASRCFPLWVDKATGSTGMADRVKAALNELRVSGGIARYEEGGAVRGRFPNWAVYQPAPKRKGRARQSAVVDSRATFDGLQFWVSDGLRASIAVAYPGVDLDAAMRDAAAWVIAGWPKTQRGDWRAFLRNWARKAHADKAAMSGPARTGEEQRQEWLRP